MIMTAEEFKTYVTTDVADPVIEAKLQAIADQKTHQQQLSAKGIPDRWND